MWKKQSILLCQDSVPGDHIHQSASEYLSSYAGVIFTKGDQAQDEPKIGSSFR